MAYLLLQVAMLGAQLERRYGKYCRAASSRCRAAGFMCSISYSIKLLIQK